MKINKLAILLFLLVGLIKPAMAQPALRDSTAAYHYSAHRGIIEMVHAFMSDYTESLDETKPIEEHIGKKEYELAFIKEINKDTLPDFTKVSIFLKTNNWAGAEKNILQPLIANYKKSLPLNADFFDLNIKKATTSEVKSDNWNKMQSEIIDRYQNHLSSLAKAPTLSVENAYEFNDPNKINITTRMILLYTLLVLIGVLIGGWLVFSFSKRKIYSILNEEKVYYLDYPPLKTEKSIFHFITLFHILKRRKDSYKKHNMDLKKELEMLELENSELKKKPLS